MSDPIALKLAAQAPTPQTVRSPAPGAFPGPELTVVIPTLNEEGNIETLVDKLGAALHGIHWEVLFVDDDSRDRTRPVTTRLARVDGRVRLLHRIGRRGLSSACIEGVQASTAPYVAVMDADLQHDESLLPRMLEVLKSGSADIVVGSRYVEGGGVQGWESRRARISNLATRLGQIILRTHVADPMSGFFMLRRDTFDLTVRRLSAVGFKILIDILASAERPLRVTELPYQFRPRLAGESKLDALVAWEYLFLLADKTLGRFVPVRFVMFGMIGLLGLGVHLLVLRFGLSVLALGFTAAQTTATGIAMVANFTLNNWLTYRDRRLKGWGFIRGLLSFALVCGIGAAANVSLASFLFGRQESWWLAGIAGAAMSSVWNYAVSAVLTWKAR
ncbi:MAG TPA: glycosyltransferase family 2 protein [Steroidobacteraceae bacterium]|nr:glycosyltransferase family 2 protein [Steroidobacteraceae bacterium]